MGLSAVLTNLKTVESSISGITRVELYSRDTIPSGALPAILHEHPSFTSVRISNGCHEVWYSIPTLIVVGPMTKDISLLETDAIILMDAYIDTIVDNDSLWGACKEAHVEGGSIEPIPWNAEISYLCVRMQVMALVVKRKA